MTEPAEVTDLEAQLQLRLHQQPLTRLPTPAQALPPAEFQCKTTFKGQDCECMPTPQLPRCRSPEAGGRRRDPLPHPGRSRRCSCCPGQCQGRKLYSALVQCPHRMCHRLPRCLGPPEAGRPTQGVLGEVLSDCVGPAPPGGQGEEGGGGLLTTVHFWAAWAKVTIGGVGTSRSSQPASMSLPHCGRGRHKGHNGFQSTATPPAHPHLAQAPAPH